MAFPCGCGGVLAAIRVTCMASVAVRVSTTSLAFSSAACCSTAACDMMEICRFEFSYCPQNANATNAMATADPEITSSVHDVFSFLTAYAEHPSYGPLLVAPLDLADKCMKLIERESEHARLGRPARIIAKMNALLDVNVVRALYGASQAGVDIELLVRGMCALRPGIRGLSDRIRVRSIVGRFLEHSRIFYFENGGEPEVYVGSADWMNRNLHERVEVLFPLKNPLLRDRVVHEI